MCGKLRKPRFTANYCAEPIFSNRGNLQKDDFPANFLAKQNISSGGNLQKSDFHANCFSGQVVLFIARWSHTPPPLS